MATKTEKKQKERKKLSEKEFKEKLAAKDKNTIDACINFCTYHILYLNDAVCNEITFLGSKLKDIPYKGNGAKKIYGALTKRVNAYREYIKTLNLDNDSLAALFSRYDEFFDDKLRKLQKAIRIKLEEEGVEQADWLASVETTITLLDYTRDASDKITDMMRQYDSRIVVMKYLLPRDLMKVMTDFSHFVQDVHVKKQIFLNEDKRITSAMENLNQSFFRPENVNTAIIGARKEINELGSEPLYL